MKFTEKIIQSINLANSTYLDSDGATQSFQPLEIYLVPKGEGDTTHERYVVDNSGIISKGAGGGNSIPMEGVNNTQSVTGPIVVGNTTIASPPSIPTDHRTIINNGINYVRGVSGIYADTAYTNNVNFSVNDSGLKFEQWNASTINPLLATISLLTFNSDYLQIARVYNDGEQKDHQLTMGEGGLGLTSYRSVNSSQVVNRYSTSVNLDATEQSLTFMFANPEIEPQTRFRKFVFTENGFGADTDYSSTVSDLDFTQKVYVDSKTLKDSIDFDIPSDVGGSASYNILGNYALVKFSCTINTSGGTKVLTTGNSHGFGAFNKIIPVASISDNSIRYIRILGYSTSQGLHIRKAFDSDDDFEFNLTDVILAPFAGAVVDP